MELTLGGLKPGEYREITEKEWEKLSSGLEQSSSLPVRVREPHQMGKRIRSGTQAVWTRCSAAHLARNIGGSVRCLAHPVSHPNQSPDHLA